MRKKLTAVVLAVLVFSLIAASAAWLGPIGSPQIGASETAVTSCDTDGVTVESYSTAFNPAVGFVMDGVSISGIADACPNEPVTIALTDGTVIAQGSTTVGTEGGDNNLASISGLAPNVLLAENFDEIHIVIG